MLNGNNLPHELLLTTKKITKLRNNIENRLKSVIKPLALLGLTCCKLNN